MKRFAFLFDKPVLLAKLERVYSPPISVIDPLFTHENDIVWNTEPLCSLPFFSLVWKDKRSEIVPSNEPLHERDIDASWSRQTRVGAQNGANNGFLQWFVLDSWDQGGFHVAPSSSETMV